MVFRGGNGGGRSFAPREMHKATCSTCKQECEVPFMPKEGRPVFCRDCFRNQRSFN
ncbi:MAG: DNA-directed RNA polymerase [Candidatus Aenigmarchaeota archaeon]|nr:DNA-directed RNA polymerase [Candidatus Aenigmarchaeota archaeon]